MIEDKVKKLFDLYEQSEKLKGTEIIRMTKRLTISQYIVNRNYQELSNTINEYEKNLSVWVGTDRSQSVLKTDIF